MKLGIVTGQLWATEKVDSLDGSKLLVVEEIAPDMSKSGDYWVAVDAVGAGEGEVVLVATGSSARQTESTRERPADAVIMAIVDGFDTESGQRYRKKDAV